MQFENTCIRVCPDLYIEERGLCSFNLDFQTVSNDILPSDYTKERLDSIIEENIINIYKVNSTIQGVDFILQVYPTDEPFKESENISSIDFSKCENVLQESEKIPPNEKIIISKIDTTNPL